LLSWISIHFKHMLKDLLIAADQVLFNLQIPKEPPALGTPPPPSRRAEELS
jgi:hypothetical protein